MKVELEDGCGLSKGAGGRGGQKLGKGPLASPLYSPAVFSSLDALYFLLL